MEAGWFCGWNGFFPGVGVARRFIPDALDGAWVVCSRRPDTLVSPGEGIGRLCIRLMKSGSRVQDDRRTSRPTGKSL